MEVACDIEMIKDPETRRSNVTYVARHIEDSLTAQREYRQGCTIKCRQFMARSCCLWFGKRYGNYLICLYLITKSLYILNVVSQFFFMNRLLGTNYTFYGIDLLRDLSEGIMWQESGNFPRITLCDFEVRKMANIHRHTVQCVLPINMFNEKIFIFLWFWFILVAAVNISSFLYWSYKSSFSANRVNFVRKFLKLRDALEPGDKKRTLAFVDSYLRQDGVFILRLVAQNAGELVTSEIIERLWNLYKARQSVVTSRDGEAVKGSISPVPYSGHPHRTNHHHYPHRHFHSPSPSTIQRSGQSSTISSPNEEIKAGKFPPPSYFPHGLRKPGLSLPSPPPLPPSVRSQAPPPLPPPPGGSERRSSSSNSRSQLSSGDEIDRPAVRARSTSRGITKPSTSRPPDEGKPAKGDEKSDRPVKPLFGSSKNGRAGQNDEDPGEFV